MGVRGGRGITTAARAIARGTTVLSVPRALVLSIFTPVDSLGEAGKAIRSLRYRVPHNAFLALIVIAHRELGTASPLAPWLAVLPRFVKRVHYSTREHRFMSSLWHNRLFLQEMQHALSEVLEESYQQVDKWLCRGTNAPLFNCDDDGPYGAEAFAQAYALVHSRCFSIEVSKANAAALAGPTYGHVDVDDLGGTCIMTPLADLFNHNASTSSAAPQYGFNAAAARFEVAVDRDHAVGEEVLIHYGPHSNTETLYSYGFVDPNNEHEAITLSIPALVPQPPAWSGGGGGGVGGVEHWRERVREALKREVPGDLGRAGGEGGKGGATAMEGVRGLGEEATEVHFTLRGIQDALNSGDGDGDGDGRDRDRDGDSDTTYSAGALATLRARSLVSEDVRTLGVHTIRARLAAGMPVTPAGERRWVEQVRLTAVDALSSFRSPLPSDIYDWNHGGDAGSSERSDRGGGSDSSEGGTRSDDEATLSGGGGGGGGSGGERGGSESGSGESYAEWLKADEVRRLRLMLLLNIETKRIFHVMLLDSLHRIWESYMVEAHSHIAAMIRRGQGRGERGQYTSTVGGGGGGGGLGPYRGAVAVWMQRMEQWRAQWGKWWYRVTGEGGAWVPRQETRRIA